MIFTELWTDGSSIENPGRGGWAALLRNDGGEERLLSGAVAGVTNNRMELTAVIEGLRALEPGARVTIYLDSAYVEKPFTQGWLRKWERQGLATRTNGDLWQQLAIEVRARNVRWHRIKGHAGVPLNERVDAIANAEARRLPYHRPRPTPKPVTAAQLFPTLEARRTLADIRKRRELREASSR